MTTFATPTGSLVLPADPGYDEARAPWNVAVDQRPAGVVRPRDEAEVAAAVRAARAAGLRVAVQGTGHRAGALGDLSGTLLLRTDAMPGVTVMPAERRARVRPGALWEDVVSAAAEHGLVALAGSSPDVGVVGFTLGGGIGYLSRRFGLAADRVTAVELVTADGTLVRADATREPDLFWALRGGGGGLGVVTALEFELLEVPAIQAGGLFWPWEEAERVLGAWRRWTAGVPAEVTSMARLLQLPPLPSVPEPLRGRAFVNVQAAVTGTPDEAAALLAPLRELGPELDLFGPATPAELLRIHGDPEGPTPGLVEHTLLDELPAAAVDALVAVAGPGTGSPLVSVELRHLGGALATAPDGAGALGTLDAAFSVHTVGVPMTPEMGAAVVERGRRVVGALSAHGRGRRYLNFVEHPSDAAASFAPDAVERLRAVRAAADPDGLFQVGHRV
jgi:FAD/FMN-containing dehydrogenase